MPSAKPKSSTKRMKTASCWNQWNSPISTCRMNSPVLSSKNSASGKVNCRIWAPQAAATPVWNSLIPSRGLIGYRGEFLTDTKGNGIMNTAFDGYAPYKGDIQYRKQGSLIAFETGESVTYGLYNAQERGTLFIGPGEKVYAGMVIGENAKTDDIEVNVCKTKHLTNTRSSGADEALRLTPPRILSLEQALDFIDTDELLEVTPNNFRHSQEDPGSAMRKRANRSLTTFKGGHYETCIHFLNDLPLSWNSLSPSCWPSAFSCFPCGWPVSLGNIPNLDVWPNYDDLLETCFNLIIGVELIRMMYYHTAPSVFEVLLFAIARQIIVEHSSAWGTLIGVCAIAVLYATRKFLFCHFYISDEADENSDTSTDVLKD